VIVRIQHLPEIVLLAAVYARDAAMTTLFCFWVRCYLLNLIGTAIAI
jgi:formate/nitrite transporter FocA (FNT family)